MAFNGSRKKVKFRWIFREKFAEKMADFFGANVAKKQSVKINQFRWNLGGKRFVLH